LEWLLLLLATCIINASAHGVMTKAVVRDGTGRTVCGFSSNIRPSWHCIPTVRGHSFRKTISGDRWPPTFGSSDCHKSPGCELDCERRAITAAMARFQCSAKPSKCTPQCTTVNQCDWCPVEIVNDRQPFPRTASNGPYGRNPAPHWDNPRTWLQRPCASRTPFGEQGTLEVKSGDSLDITQFISVDHSSIYRFELSCGKTPSSADLVQNPISPWMAQVRFRGGKSNNNATVRMDRVVGYTKAETDRYYSSMACSGQRCDTDNRADTWRISTYPYLFSSQHCEGREEECTFTDRVTIPSTTDCSNSGGYATFRWSMLSAESFEVYGQCLDLKIEASVRNPPPPPPFSCTILDAMVNLRDQSPPEWCNERPGRRASRQACEAAYVRNQDDETVQLCRYDAAVGDCTLRGSARLACRGTASLPPPPSPPPPPPPPKPDFDCASMPRMIGLQPPEFCNSDAGRRTSHAACEAAYIMGDDGSILLCKFDATRGRPCRLQRSASYMCSDPPPVFRCSDLESMVALSSGSWCNSDAGRTAARSRCEAAYRVVSNGDVRLCKYSAAASQCKLDQSESYSCGVSPGPPPPGNDAPSLCESLASMVHVRALSPPQWCGSDTRRLKSKSVCESAYITKENGQILRCKHDAGHSTCVTDRSVQYDCRT